jgi:hypothetical protein
MQVNIKVSKARVSTSFAMVYYGNWLLLPYLMTVNRLLTRQQLLSSVA